MKKKFTLRYGRTSHLLEMDERHILGVLENVPFSPARETTDLINHSLDHPIGTLPFNQIAKKGEKVAIVVSDRTRKTGAELFIPILIERLNYSGIPDSNISIVFSTGIHPLDTKEDQVKIVGKEIARRIKLVEHNARDEENLVEVGTTKRGNKVKLNKWVVGADRKIITGSVSYHYFAGYGGGAKAIVPGIAGWETVQFNHRLSMLPEAATGKIDGNPLREDLEEAADFLKADYLLNTVMMPEGKIAAVFSGGIKVAHRAAVEYLDKHCKIEVREKADLVIASAGGWPKDINFVQAHKGMEHASYVLKPGGVLFFLGECLEGYPSPAYEKYINLGSAEEIEKSLAKEFYVSGHTVYSAFQKANKFKIIWLTKLSPQSLAPMGIEAVSTVEEGWEKVKDILGDSFKSYIIPNASSAFPSMIL
jgi:nickel-dependent lactate racemase